MAVMGGEPWCFPPAVIARLTDYQILHVYVYPLVERNERMKREQTGQSGTIAAPRIAADSFEDLMQVYREMGMSEATARAMAEDEWHSRR